ncbi:hypothetical protein OSB04_002840 [Centaurea solstitialis]|uniref:Uncharacterized protein n=1 Tax=Centaurea solstitialis TaxID=347529 RepID=A0AA38TVI1_9ASTR|nr:hypothetical protein OSB04_002840 [Centaurea solstitialis]
MESEGQEDARVEMSLECGHHGLKGILVFDFLDAQLQFDNWIFRLQVDKMRYEEESRKLQQQVKMLKLLKKIGESSSTDIPKTTDVEKTNVMDNENES